MVTSLYVIFFRTRLPLAQCKLISPLLFTDYYWNGFLSLQYQVDKAIIETLNISADLQHNYDLYMQKMPYLPFLMDVLMTVLSHNIPLFLVLSFILNALMIAKNIAYEKEKKLKVCPAHPLSFEFIHCP